MSIIRCAISLVILLSAVSCPVLAVEVFFSPSRDCENRIVDAANNAKVEINAAVYSINNPRIVAALEAAHRRGTKVRILTDRTQAGGKSSLVLELVKAGVPLRVHTKHKIEHNKFGMFDDKVAISGSYNWTAPASEVNSENCVVMSEANAIAAYKSDSMSCGL